MPGVSDAAFRRCSYGKDVVPRRFKVCDDARPRSFYSYAELLVTFSADLVARSLVIAQWGCSAPSLVPALGFQLEVTP